MPNTNRPWGLQPSGVSLTGGCIQTRPFKKAAGYGTRIRAFDAVTRANDGTIQRPVPGTGPIQGVSLTYGAASTATDHLVIEDPFMLFVAQGGGSTGFAEADANLNANLSLGTTSIEFSDDVVNDGTEAVGATLDVQIYGLVPDVDNSWGQYVKIHVLINNHRQAAGRAGL